MKTAIFILIGLVVCIYTSAFAEDISVVREPAAMIVQADQPVSGDRDVYFGTLRVYLVEPVSRWQDLQNHDYEFGFLKFMEVTVLDLDDGESYYNEVETIFSALDPTNLGVVAALFGADGYLADAYPQQPNPPHPFMAYPTDNAAMAVTTSSGEPGFGIPPTGHGFTHPVLLRKARLLGELTVLQRGPRWRASIVPVIIRSYMSLWLRIYMVTLAKHIYV